MAEQMFTRTNFDQDGQKVISPSSNERQKPDLNAAATRVTRELIDGKHLTNEAISHTSQFALRESDRGRESATILKEAAVKTRQILKRIELMDNASRQLPITLPPASIKFTPGTCDFTQVSESFYLFSRSFTEALKEFNSTFREYYFGTILARMEPLTDDEYRAMSPMPAESDFAVADGLYIGGLHENWIEKQKKSTDPTSKPLTELKFSGIDIRDFKFLDLLKCLAIAFKDEYIRKALEKANGDTKVAAQNSGFSSEWEFNNFKIGNCDNILHLKV